MFLMSGEAKYADVLEREVYNGLISGVSLGGDRFFYVNPLGSVGKHHRVPWFDCSCCPTNIVRYIPGMGERVYAHRDNDIWTVLYMSNTATIPLKDGKVKLTQETNYPWDGKIKIKIEPENPFFFTLHLRIPGWCRFVRSLKENDQVRISPNSGLRYSGPQFITLGAEWKAGDVIELELDMPVERVYADPHVKADVGRVALERGPVVYCLEGVDNNGSVRNLCLPRGRGGVTPPLLTATFEKDLLGGVVVVRGEALAVSRPKDKWETKPVAFQAVPYFAWDNRKPGQMIVWLAEDPERAEIPGEDGVLINGVRIRASHVNPTDTLETLTDGEVPRSSKDHGIRRMTWWDHRGTSEWVSYQFAQPRTLTGAEVYWFDDTGIGACRVPAEWRLLWRDGDKWKPVKRLPGESYGTALDRFNKVSFEPVTTRELRLEVKLKPEVSGGILKWRVTQAK
jgi:hypothetical protein